MRGKTDTCKTTPLGRIHSVFVRFHFLKALLFHVALGDLFAEFRLSFVPEVLLSLVAVLPLDAFLLSLVQLYFLLEVVPVTFVLPERVNIFPLE